MDKRGTCENIVEMIKNCCTKEGQMTDCFSEIRKVMDRKGTGSPCAEMMEKIMKHQENGCSFHWDGMMKKMMKDFNKVQKEPEGCRE